MKLKLNIYKKNMTQIDIYSTYYSIITLIIQYCKGGTNNQWPLELFNKIKS